MKAWNAMLESKLLTDPTFRIIWPAGINGVIFVQYYSLIRQINAGLTLAHEGGY